MTSLKLAYAGSPTVAAKILEALVKTREHEIGLVMTGTDKRVGRGRRIQANPVKQCALDFQLPLVQPTSINEIAAETLSSYDFLIVVAYGVFLPTSLIYAPRFGSINLHFSLLPRWRGASPLQSVLLAGERETGVSVMQINEGLDTGPVYVTCPYLIAERETTATLEERLTQLAIPTLEDFLSRYLLEKPASTPQDESLATQCTKISKSQARINWQHASQEIDRYIRAFNPKPVAYTYLADMRIKIWEAIPLPSDYSGNYSGKPGMLFKTEDGGLGVVCGDGAIQITRLQLPSKRAMTAQEFLHGKLSVLTSYFE